MANIIRRNQDNPAQAQVWEPLRMMRELMGWDPFAEMMPSMRRELSGFAPQFEIKETQDAFVFKADMPGVREEDLDITLTGSRLTVSGKRDIEERRDDDRFSAYERSFGSFTRSFTLPEGADSEHVTAELANGVLTLQIPKVPEHQPKKVTIKSVADKIKGALGKSDKAHA